MEQYGLVSAKDAVSNMMSPRPPTFTVQEIAMNERDFSAQAFIDARLSHFA